MLTIWLKQMVKHIVDDTTEARIRAAAKNVFLLKGMDGARMQDIAQEAGINKAMLHYYFRNKEKLFETIFQDIAREFIPRISAVIESEMDLFKKIEILCREYISQFVKTPFVPIFILNEINKQPKEFMKKMWGEGKPPTDIFFQEVKAAIRKGIIREINPAHLFLNILSLCVFPFAARPLIQLVLGLNKSGFEAMMEQRKKEIPKLIIESIKK